MFRFCSRMNGPADLTLDKHGYVRFDCPACPRTAKLKHAVIVAHYRPETGMAAILRTVAPNDCKSPACAFRVRP